MSLTSKLGISGAVLAASLALGKPAEAQNPPRVDSVVKTYYTTPAQAESLPPYLQNTKQNLPISGLFVPPFGYYYPADMINQICAEVTEYQAQHPQVQAPQAQRATRTPAHTPRKILRHVPRATARSTTPAQTTQTPYHINSDSLARELVRRAQTKVDSIYAERASRIRADSIRNDSIANTRHLIVHPVQSTGPEFRLPREARRNSVEFGLGALYGTNKELSLEAFVNGQLFRGLRLEAYGDWSAIQENSYDTFNHSDTTQVLRESLSPGIYKTTNTVINTSRFQRGIAEVGGRVVVSPAEWFDILLGAGARIVRGTEDKNGQETISYETNKVQRDSTYNLSNSKENNVTNVLLSLGAGARFNFSGVNLNLNYNRVGKRNIWKGGLGFTF